MAYIEWVQALAANKASTKVTSNLVAQSSNANVDATPNSFYQSYGYLNTTRINSDGTAESGVQFSFDSLEQGDMIEIEAEIRTISGVAPKLKISEYDATNKVDNAPVKKTFPASSEWRTVKLKTYINILKGWYNNRAFLGLEVGESGVFEVRNVRAIAYTKTNEPQTKFDKGYFTYKIDKTAGTWAIDTSVSSAGSLALPQNWNLDLTFASAKYKPRIFIDSTAGKTYRFYCTFAPSSTKVTLGCMRLSDSDEMWTNVPDGTSLYINVYYNV